MNIRYNQTATLWRATPDGFGGFTFTAPIALQVRWVDKVELIPGSASILSKAVVYVPVDVSLEDFLFLGESDALTPVGVAGAYKVVMFSKIPDLRNLNANRKAWLI